MSDEIFVGQTWGSPEEKQVRRRLMRVARYYGFGHIIEWREDRVYVRVRRYYLASWPCASAPTFIEAAEALISKLKGDEWWRIATEATRGDNTSYGQKAK
jgi:hypothetical protein